MKKLSFEKIKKSLGQSMLLAAFVIPMEDANQWQALQYRGIPANKVKFSKEKLTIQVNKSASPLLYPFQGIKKIKRFTIQAKVNGKALRFPANTTQGSKGFDDYPLRVGFVIKGERRLNWFERQVAPNWLVTIHKSVPAPLGVKRVDYLCVANQSQLVGTQRKHPLNDLINEEVLSTPTPEGNITMEKTWATPIEAIGLIISSDGDDTKVNFDLEILSIEIETV